MIVKHAHGTLLICGMNAQQIRPGNKYVMQFLWNFARGILRCGQDTSKNDVSVIYSEASGRAKAHGHTSAPECRHPKPCSSLLRHPEKVMCRQKGLLGTLS